MIARLSIAFTIAVWSLVAIWLTSPLSAIQMQVASLRGPVFAGLLFSGVLTTALKHYVLVRLKREVYDTAEYRERVKEMQGFNPRITQYGPLQRLCLLFGISSLATLVAALAQLTIGLMPGLAPALCCIFVVVYSVSLEGFSIALIYQMFREDLAK